MAEALLGIVSENLQTFVRQQLATLWGVDSQIQKLSSNLTTIRAVLRDAEEKQITSHAVKDWLQKLSDAAYVLDDILDECSIHSSLSRFSPKTLLFRLDVGKRMKEMVDRFHDINEERKTFELRPAVIERQQEDDDEWRQTCSAITLEHQIYGRNHDKEKIVEFLLSNANDNGNFSVYAILGMGGLGKTTLAQCVFKDHGVSKHFDLKIWVCVSNNFDVIRILQAIVESATGQNPNLSTLESIQKKVQEVLLGKRYFLVLDDVWNEDQAKWDKLKSVLNCGGETKAASILVTTRLDSVASIMGTCPTHQLLPLSEDDNLSLFKHHAFGPNMEGPAELVAIGEEIVRKCEGNPLASKALGSLLRNKTEEKQWLNIKESKLWDLPQGGDIMRALRISYFNLKLPLRRCFSFCAIYPEDYRISKEQLIHLWMANGLIQSRGNLEVEDVGNEAWEELCQRSFFQKVNIDFSGKVTFKIHDLFLELAQSIMGEECKVSKSKNLDNLSSRVHHVSCTDTYEGFNMEIDALRKFESLRTLIHLDPTNAFSGLKGFNSTLRALRTGSYQLSGLKSLIHLRYLNLCLSAISMLPECISRLQKLQILKLEHCLLYCLPNGLTQLKDLRHVLIEGCDLLEKLPPNIGKLKCLKTLNIFIVGSKPGFGLEELRDLQLGGKLHIKGLENALSESDARSANMIGKKELSRLYLSWDYPNSILEHTNSERILEALEPHSNLKKFGIKGYRGLQFPGWMMNTSNLSCLVCVILYDCKNCGQLPPLGKLPHLENLHVSGMIHVKYIDDDSYDGYVEEKAFKSLKMLTLGKLPNLERILRDETVEMLPLLSELRVSCVPKLWLPPLESLESLQIHGMDFPSYVKGIGNEDMDSFSGAILQNMTHLKVLRIGRFRKLKVLPDELGSLSSLQGMRIRGYDELESLPENVLQGLSSLRTLEIWECKKLKSLSQGFGYLTCLEKLEIKGCPELVTLPNNMNQLTVLGKVSISGTSTLPEGLQHIPSLQSLTIEHAEADSLPEWLGDMTSLQQLEINSCSNLSSLPSSFQRLTNLRRLSVQDCPMLEKRCKRPTGEDWPKNAHIPHTEITSGEPELTICEYIRLAWSGRNFLWNIWTKKRGLYDSLSEFDTMVDEF